MNLHLASFDYGASQPASQWSAAYMIINCSFLNSEKVFVERISCVCAPRTPLFQALGFDIHTSSRPTEESGMCCLQQHLFELPNQLNPPPNQLPWAFDQFSNSKNRKSQITHFTGREEKKKKRRRLKNERKTFTLFIWWLQEKVFAKLGRHTNRIKIVLEISTNLNL